MKPLINLVFEEQNLYGRLSGRENLQLFADLYRRSRGRADELLEAVGLTEAAARKVKTYSSGMKQRLLVARALLNRPRVLFLDEPTRGLDPTSAREVRAMVREQARQGTTVFLTTHYMEEADELCDRVAFLAAGRIVALDTPRELKLRYGERSALVLLDSREEERLRLDDPADAARLERWMAEGRGPHRALAGGHARGRLRQPRREATVNWSRIRTIYRKDMRDALRDSRVLTALLLPLALGLLYSFMFSDENIKTQKAKVGVVSDGPTQLTNVISQQTGRGLRLTFVRMPSAAALRAAGAAEEGRCRTRDPARLRRRRRAGASPLLTVVLPSSPSFDSDYVDAVLDRSVQSLAGRAPPARIVQRSLPPETGGADCARGTRRAQGLHPRLDHHAAGHDRRVRGAGGAGRGDREEDHGGAHAHRLHR